MIDVQSADVSFTLPRGYLDDNGGLHREGAMRLATALDEVQPLGDPRVQANQAYVSILLLSRVLTRLGTLSPVPPRVVESLYSADFAYLQELYVRLNSASREAVGEAECPACGTTFDVDLA